MQTPPSVFPAETAWSVVLAARDRASPTWRERLDDLARSYWRPVCTYLRCVWNLSPEDAADLTQTFFIKFFDEGFMQGADPARGRFRTFIKMKLRCLVIDELRRAGARKRGGGARPVELAPEDEELRWPGLSPEEAFDREWARCLLTDAMRELEELLSGRPEIFRAFRHCAAESPPKSYRECADLLGLKQGDVRNHVFRGRTLLREIVRRRVRDSVLGEAEVDAELPAILTLFER